MADLPLDRYIVDVLMPDLIGHDRSASTFLVYLYLWRQSVARGRATVEVSHQTIASDIGLAKTTVQAAIRRLKRRRLLSAKLRHATATPIYQPLRPWIGKLPP
ncbi:helix-turn-helix domain-containing protein [Dokdonella soli]|uniref:Helix-turn-helix domain-containing protein n=1 Tax=Dokdonella soli TaxID=529810 RepID=A0ABN1IEW0_9GAMM